MKVVGNLNSIFIKKQINTFTKYFTKHVFANEHNTCKNRFM